MDLPSIAEPAEKERPYISTGHLPEPETVQKLLTDAHQRFKSNTDGENSQVYPALARVPRDLFGVCVVGTSGRVHGAGDIEYEFSIMLAGDVGSMRGTTQNLAAAVGTAVAGALLVGLLSTIVLGNIAANPLLPKEIQAQVDLDNVTFVSNDRLRSVMENTTATPQQVQEAVRVNTEARLRALKIGLLLMAGLALLAVIPAGQLPNYLPGELPSDEPTAKGARSI